MDSRHSTVAANILLEMSYGSRAAELNKDYPRVLTLLANHFIGMEDGFAAIRKLGASNVRLRIWVEENLFNTMALEEIVAQSGVDDIILPANSLPPSPSEADALFIPVLSLSLLSRLTQLDTGHPFVQLIVLALCAGKPVAALTLGAEPDHYRWGEQGLSQASPLLKEQMLAMVSTIEGFGIKLLEPDKVGNWLSSAEAPLKKQILTAEDIRSARKLDRTIIVLSRHAVITPLAADMAREYRIELQFK
ncbi:hypothetical protein H1230_05665 [Paenibacillus sp. 19GGS1-52]|uniref:hypothetical protein n=1 Tax=Paenibacillus sp. 19GGS1-52 TaxID=2758563 RepID=UPI001EFB7F51|nr:hypothetical protein [Paenibacillus sp. 19GGS1-52]ULO08304.1 hypothetical protein H1230_05665 [Paenibacillus sp. 19GGS1-52]